MLSGPPADRHPVRAQPRDAKANFEYEWSLYSETTDENYAELLKVAAKRMTSQNDQAR